MRLAAAVMMIGVLCGGAAQAQSALCRDPGAFCRRMLSGDCLQRFGAGVGAAPSSDTASLTGDCAAQSDAYFQCVESAAEECGSGPTAASDVCDADMARELWAIAEADNDCLSYKAFLQACPDARRASFAQSRLERLGCGNAGGGARPQTASSIEERLSRELAGVGPDAVAAATADDGGTELVRIGYRYDTGADGKPQNDAIAFRLYDAACQRGHAKGCSNLAVMYREGRSVPASDTEAVRLFRVGCDGGDAPGCNGLGYMYDNGKGVAEDNAEAVRLFRQSCEGGYGVGCSNLGIMYRYGNGVTADRDQAVRYYRRALELDPNFERAASELKDLGETP